MEPMLSAFDSISVALLLTAFIKRDEVRATQIQMAEMESAIAATRVAVKVAVEAGVSQAGELQQVLKEQKVLLAAVAFRSWIGKNTFAVTLAFGLISLFIGITSVPGALLGFAFSSPRFGYLVITTFNRNVEPEQPTSPPRDT
jgi:hypothetical protein